MFYLFANPGPNNFHGITVNGIGIDNAMKVMLRAQERRYWRDTTRFLSARIGSIQAANDLDPTGDWAARLKKAWDAVEVCQLKGDVHEDGILTAADIIPLLYCTFSNSLCGSFCASDVNCDGILTGADIVILLNMVYLGVPDHCAPA